MAEKKSSKIWILILILGIVLGVATIFTYRKNKAAAPNGDLNVVTEATVEEVTPVENNDLTGTTVIANETDYLNAIQNKLALDCKVTSPSAMLIKADAGHTKMRSQVTVDDVTTNSLLIGETAFSWNEGEKTGTKMTITPELREQALKLAENSYEAENEMAEPSLDCSAPTGLDFEMPAGVEFQDLSAMMQNIGVDLSEFDFSEIDLSQLQAL